MTEESIISKIRKLLALAAGTDNEAEAASAAAMAQKLMSEHSIVSAMLEVTSPGEAKEDIVNPSSHLGKYSSWKGLVLNSIAKANACGFYKSDQNDFATHHSMHLFGRGSDIDLCRTLFEWIVEEIDHLAKVRCPGEGRTFSHNYRYGCAESVARAVRAEFDAAESNALENYEGTSALVVLKDALAVRRDHTLAVRSFGREKLRLRISGKQSFNPNAVAREAGRVAGRSIYQGKSPTRKIT